MGKLDIMRRVHGSRLLKQKVSAREGLDVLIQVALKVVELIYDVSRDLIYGTAIQKLQ